MNIGIENEKERSNQYIVLPGQTPEGEYILGILVKRSYDVMQGKICKRAGTDKKLIPGDIYYDDPMNSTVKYESDFIPFKVATDVVLNGKAYAPKDEMTKTLTASLIINKTRKNILIIGDRVCLYQGKKEPIFTEPQPFKTMDIKYELAYGGIDIYSDLKNSYPYPRNHLGRGFVISRDKKAIENIALPNIEDPNDLITPERLICGDFKEWERQPLPQGFGWYSKYWQPRASFAGVMPADRSLDQQLRKIYAKVLTPEHRKLYEQNQLPDMDFRFFNGAAMGLALPFLSGYEEIKTINLSSEGELFFKLPGNRPDIALDIGLGIQEPPIVLQTVLIRMDDRQVDLVWRAAASYPGPDWLQEMKKMEVMIQ